MSHNLTENSSKTSKNPRTTGFNSLSSTLDTVLDQPIRNNKNVSYSNQNNNKKTYSKSKHKEIVTDGNERALRILESLTKSEIRVANVIVHGIVTRGWKKASKISMSHYAHCSESTVHRAMRKLEATSIFDVTRSKDKASSYLNNTNVYTSRLRNLFYDHNVRKRLSKIFSCFRSFSLSLLLSFAAFHTSNKNDTLLNSKNNLLLKSSYRDSHYRLQGEGKNNNFFRKIPKTGNNKDMCKEVSQPRSKIGPLRTSYIKAEIVSFLNPTDRFLIEIEKFNDVAVLYASNKVKEYIASGAVYSDLAPLFFKHCYEFMKLSGASPNNDVTSILKATYNPAGEWFSAPQLPIINKKILSVVKETKVPYYPKNFKAPNKKNEKLYVSTEDMKPIKDRENEDVMKRFKARKDINSMDTLKESVVNQSNAGLELLKRYGLI